ncbi:CNNM domain-containing protein [Sulfurimonas sp. HSL-1716]|uniref:CNNM domain-containing protein n=1 Tax=Hydrocurvibacter sulfurireducens TaxID=3131937 RepID=UPI0031F7C972
MELLVLFFVFSISVSFICSVLESVLLSVNIPYIAVLEKHRPRSGGLLRMHKEHINKSIAAILIINTVANTLGAAAVGAQASKVFGSDAVVLISIFLTFAILFFSEIIPKTIGAVYYKQLAPASAHIIKFFIFLTYPVILLTLFITNKISKNRKNLNGLSKEELLQSTLLSENQGVLDEQESDAIENILKLDEIKVKEILTPRSVVFALDEDMLLKDVIAAKKEIFQFSRIPIYKGSFENVTGIVLTKNIFKQVLEDDNVKIGSIKKDIFSINKNLPVSIALDLFISKKEHMFLVKDQYDQNDGIVTLEDCIETILGVEIVDESDLNDDMRELAKIKMRIKRKTVQ